MRFGQRLATGWLLATGAAFSSGAQASTPVGDRVAFAAAQLAGERIPYVTGNLGGPHGPEEAGLPAVGLDCMTFVEAALMRAQQIHSADLQQRWLQQTRYDGNAPSYCTRAHYLSDWASRNAKQGWIVDVTRDIATAGAAPLQQHRWKRTWMSTHGLDPAGCTDAGDAPEPAAYIAPADYERIEAQVEPGDILTFVARDAGLDSVHVAIAQPGGGLAMASSISGGTVLKRSWVGYARERKKFLGLRVFRVRELPPDAGGNLSARPLPSAPAGAGAAHAP
ncbi:uncharacterized protein DUF1460 [Panacagrimonas perspica]|uniref:Uncharacterized protein DUF1460 n=1 Tax=Panacagrimonas perspica TaxID=381431 RepID=A0A4R7P191_9GAMM|nr:N-acetylmuramoyl-L-alanine amidase-like domain-containing protein [Panacagrimonas perspica]TDU26620.1 uncharacterized protein DUF1460 [Panacagrimonas perspica]THD03980.1 hypothetical protein B1810_06870 [Panacagrimonas perspica]